MRLFRNIHKNSQFQYVYEKNMFMQVYTACAYMFSINKHSWRELYLGRHWIRRPHRFSQPQFSRVATQSQVPTAVLASWWVCSLLTRTSGLTLWRPPPLVGVSGQLVLPSLFASRRSSYILDSCSLWICNAAYGLSAMTPFRDFDTVHILVFLFLFP